MLEHPQPPWIRPCLVKKNMLRKANRRVFFQRDGEIEQNIRASARIHAKVSLVLFFQNAHFSAHLPRAHAR